MKEKNIQTLADLLAKSVGIKAQEQPEDTIEAAIEKLEKDKETKKLAKSVEDVLPESQEDLKEEMCDLYTSTISSPIWDYVAQKYNGTPDLKSWADLQLTKSDLCDDVDEEAEWDDLDLSDNDYDRENGITYDDIDQFLATVPLDDFVNYYDDGELDVQYGDQDQFMKDPEYCACADYSDDELAQCQCKINQEILDCTDPHQLREALSIQQRLRKAIKMRAKASQIALKRKIAMMKRASPEKIQQRARRLAIRMLKSKFAGNKPFNELGYSDRERVEKIVDSKPALVNALQRKMVPIVRKIEQERFSHNAA